MVSPAQQQIDIAAAAWQFNEAVSMLSQIESEGSIDGLLDDIVDGLPAMRDALLVLAGIASGRIA